MGGRLLRGAVGAALGLVVGIAGGVLFGAYTHATMQTPGAWEGDRSFKARRLAQSISEGMNCGALVTLVAVPLGVVVALARKK